MNEYNGLIYILFILISPRWLDEPEWYLNLQFYSHYEQ
jgi:hypothetical protein